MSKERFTLERAVQLSFFKTDISFGGSLLKNSHAREPRPLSTKNFLHIVLKSDVAKKTEINDLRLTSKRLKVAAIIKGRATDFGVRIHSQAIASNHIHLLISFKSRKKYMQWIRRLTGLIARLMLGAEKGKPSQTSFWSYRPFTRIVYWGRDFRAVSAYIGRNMLEAVGFIDYVPRSYPKISSG